ncbi:unnamed protein product [Durusdinium trenchii]|uniref:DUF7630 domain-containing protein n=2 Tax=Durusdinium trenchii TaxID=1381693 RepID=A0ABP0HCW6_9DINO
MSPWQVEWCGWSRYIAGLHSLRSCLGGDVLCQVKQAVGSFNSECVGKYGNLCAEGSTGMLCGECPAGWARPSLQEPCEPCPNGAVGLFFLILADVVSKACINCIVASLAATAAVRGSSKLHTSMIRIGSQWLAACSVIATFRFDQLRILSFSRTSQGQDEAFQTLSWPPEITRAMRTIFHFLSLQPVLVSVDLGASCAAEDLFPGDLTARNMAPGIYSICLPPLLTVGIIVLSYVVVHGLVPLANQRGIVFNQADKNKKAREKAVSRLQDALVPLLADSGLSWDEIQQSGVFDMILSALEEACAEPNIFLRKAVTTNRALLLKACQLRAAESELSSLTKCSEAEISRIEISDLIDCEDFNALLDNVISRANQRGEQNREPVANPPKEDENGELRDAGLGDDGPITGPQTDSSDDDEARISVSPVHQPKAAEVNLAEEKPEAPVSQEDNSMDSLDFGLFSPKAPLSKLVIQSLPIVWIGFLSLWPALLSQFLQMLWCVPILEDETVVSRLLPSPDVRCGSSDHLPSAAVAICGLLGWCVGIPIALAVRLVSLEDRQTPENYRKYGYFIQGYEPQYWWWDILIKRADIGAMMVITYTSIVPDSEAKLMLFPVLSGLQLAMACWIKPFSNDQAEILDVLEVSLAAIRFLLFSSVGALLILNPSAGTASCLATMLFVALLTACVYFILHVVAQLLRDASLNPEKPPEGFSKPIMKIVGRQMHFAVCAGILNEEN